MCLEAYNGRQILLDAAEFLGSIKEKVIYNLPYGFALLNVLRFTELFLSSWDHVLHFTKP